MPLNLQCPFLTMYYDIRNFCSLHLTEVGELTPPGMSPECPTNPEDPHKPVLPTHSCLHMPNPEGGNEIVLGVLTTTVLKLSF